MSRDIVCTRIFGIITVITIYPYIAANKILLSQKNIHYINVVTKPPGTLTIFFHKNSEIFMYNILIVYQSTNGYVPNFANSHILLSYEARYNVN